MLKVFKDLLAAAFDLTEVERRRTVRIVSMLAALLVAVVIAWAWRTSGNVVPAESPVWEAVLQTRLVLVRIVLAVPLVVIGAYTALLIFQALENSALGARLFIVVKTDFEMTREAKVKNRGTVLAALFIACILGLLLGVLR